MHFSRVCLLLLLAGVLGIDSTSFIVAASAEFQGKIHDCAATQNCQSQRRPYIGHMPCSILGVWPSVPTNDSSKTSRTATPARFLSFVRAKSPHCISLTPTKSSLLLSSSSLYATSRGGAATKNNRDSGPKHLGVKKTGGEFVLSGNILIRQRGTPFKPGEGVIRTGDDTLVAKTAGYVCMRQTYSSTTRGSGGRLRVSPCSSRGRRVKAACIVSIKPSLEETRNEKAEKVGLLRTLARTWMQEENPNALLPPINTAEKDDS